MDQQHMPIGIQASPLQIRKLVKGMKVRLKKGTGFCLLVHPEKYHLMSRTFGRDKGMDVSLTEQELKANANASAFEELPMSGSGIFGKQADKWMKKHGVKKAVYDMGTALKPVAHQLIDQGKAMAMAYGVPEQLVDPVAKLGKDYIDDPESLQGKKGRRELKNRGLDLLQSGMDEMGGAYGMKAPNVRDYEKMVQDARHNKSAPSSTSGLTTKGMKNMAGQYAKQHAYDYLNKELGTNTGYNLKAGLGRAEMSDMAGKLLADQITAKYSAPPMAPPDQNAIEGFGFGRHHGMGFGLMRHSRREIGSITGRGGALVHAGPYGSPAMVSQPYGANFQMQNFLPPQYQGYFHPQMDHGHGMGLYAGRGLY
jgi:hypothetical protein